MGSRASLAERILRPVDPVFRMAGSGKSYAWSHASTMRLVPGSTLKKEQPRANVSGPNLFYTCHNAPMLAVGGPPCCPPAVRGTRERPIWKVGVAARSLLLLGAPPIGLLSDSRSPGRRQRGGGLVPQVYRRDYLDTTGTGGRSTRSLP